ncbi:MAG: tyrosine-protein phosphatase [Elusimicrobia bacterium]|nr:tyrosine-protein phosphatase [Elusimicrobiota bacterium]
MTILLMRSAKRLRAAALVLACAIGATASDTAPHGVPNLVEVAPGVYRGGQPTTAGWAFLKSRGVRTVVKLNFASEGSDGEAQRLGMRVIDASGPPSEVRDVLERPNPERVRLAVDSLRDETLRPVFVHCLHGQDRTGLIVGLYRVLHDGFTKKAAYREMRKLGYHRSLRGLREFWEEFDGKAIRGGKHE